MHSPSAAASTIPFLRAVARLAGPLTARQARQPRAMGEGTAPLFRADLAADKRRALDLARDARLVGEHGFAIALLQAVIEGDPSSPLAWAYLADARRAAGDLDGSLEARARHLALAGGDAGWEERVRAARLDVASRLRDRTVAAAPEPGAEAIAAAARAALGGEAEPGRPIPDSLVHAGDTAAAMRIAHAEVARAARHAGAATAADAALARALAGATEPHDRPLLTESAARTLSTIDVSGFRQLVTGKRVCLVANSATVATSGLGEVIDSYDLVVRFNSFKIDAPHTGSRTSVHALIHLHDFNWDVPVDVRLVFSGDPVAWRRSLLRRVVAGAQTHLGDETLRWPMRDAQLVGDTTHPDLPTTGFNVIRLLDFLDVSAAIDLIGFDFYEGGTFRLDEAMHLPVVDVHQYSVEKEWVLDRAVSVDGPIISLR
ncbi:glycosyltransferase family 29 protein [Demequina iriomotensis]|uniref:glycosyltransferase family 29 protein n=1 Tax=Demequina iriomotensis TaxID=1536641 RepID=UPI0012E0BB23|nr:glycosyltransferase family 29 protein [Demequina iriomotensis]